MPKGRGRERSPAEKRWMKETGLPYTPRELFTALPQHEKDERRRRNFSAGLKPKRKKKKKKKKSRAERIYDKTYGSSRVGRPRTKAELDRIMVAGARERAKNRTRGSWGGGSW